MIYNFRNRKPIIKFSLKTSSIEQVGSVGQEEEVRVWLDTIYNKDEYTFNFVGVNLVTKISDYEYIVSSPIEGLVNFYLEVESINGVAPKQTSNVLTYQSVGQGKILSSTCNVLSSNCSILASGKIN